MPRPRRDVFVPEPLTVHYRKGLLAVLCLFLLGAMVYGLFMTWAFFAGYLGVPLLGALMSLAFVPFAIALWVAGRALFWRGPVLELDEDGITDHRRREPYAAWDDIDDVFLGYGLNGWVRLAIQFRNPADAERHLEYPSWLNLLERMVYRNGHWNLKLAGLDTPMLTILRTAEAYRRQSVLRRVERIKERDAARADILARAKAAVTSRG
jgi:hypothetical protein